MSSQYARPSAAPAFALRAASTADEPFLDALFAESLGPVGVALRGLPDGGAAMRSQLREGQRRSWREAFGEDGHAVVLVDDTPVGRLWTARVGADELRLVDVALLERARGRGLGTALVARVLEEAAVEGRAVVLHVARDNPARRLYARLGFDVTAEDAVHLRMEAAPR